MSALESTDIQDSATTGLASQNDQPDGPSSLPPFSGNLSVDEELKLSNKNFKKTIDDFLKDRNISPLSQLTATPPLPTPHVLAQFASKTYTDYKRKETDAQYETRLALPDGWKLLTTASNGNKTNGYFGAAYWHPERQQAVIAHRGTKLTNVGALWTDLVGVMFKHQVPQMCSASTFAHKVVEVLREVKSERQVIFQLSFTGHSLGGWLAQVTTFTTEYLKTEENLFLRRYNDDNDCYHPHTVVFDSPGCKSMLSEMKNEYFARLDGSSIALKHLDITSYLSAPNRINTYKKHVGTVYRIFPDLSDTVWLVTLIGTVCRIITYLSDRVWVTGIIDTVYRLFTYCPDTVWFTGIMSPVYSFFSYLSDTVWLTSLRRNVYRFFSYFSDLVWQIQDTLSYNKKTHSMKKLVQAFDPETGQVHKDEQCQLKVQVVVDWPISGGLRRGDEYKKFFAWAEHLNNYHPDIKDLSMQYCPIRYQTKRYDERVNSFSIFSEEEKEFLHSYCWLRQRSEFFKPQELFSVMGDNQAQDEAAKLFQNFEIKNDTIHCADASVLQALIPYVKRLLQLFPEIKEIRKMVYQCETRSCIEQINQSPLDFNPDALNVREFLENEEQQVLQLHMVGGDEWTGLIKVYQVLQKTGCLMEGRYTVLKLERLLTLNMLMDFRTLMLSIKAPYLILVACEASQLLKEETKDMIRKVFETMKQKPFIKIILTTRSEDRTANFLQNTSSDKFGNGLVTRHEQLTWCDITSSSQEKLLEKPVKFQDANISLKEIVSAESVVTKFLPLGALLEERELIIADLVLKSNDYSESYYTGRNLQQKAIKHEIFSDKGVKEEHVFLASTEKEFKKLCQLYPNSDVHWVQKDKLGKLLWQQSQGSLETVRKYIDTHSSHTYTADDLDKLLEQVEHQSVMLIADPAGMGKSTVLTHLSKQIKQKFPNKWVVRIDLNDHTDALKALKQEQIGKEKVVEFVSEKLLKLKPGLELELFKQCCEKKQKVRVVIMFDGFDEISPFYKETVNDLVQGLRQTAVEQLWITTRPHLRDELEDKLQQLSYTLEPFSESNQVEFLTKFWSLKDWFTETNDKGEDKEIGKLEIYAENLIKKLSESISDKDREFTGIPLHTHMLAEAFDEEVRIFYQSDKSKPEIKQKLDLLGLYERFIERKYDIYQEEKLQVSVNNTSAIEQRERDLKSMGLDNQLLALKVLFTEEQVALFKKNKKCSFSAEELTRIGIVQIKCEGKPQFIHRTFAEYYVADCLVNIMAEGKNTSKHVVGFILKDILLKDDYRVIRVFVDGLLSRTKISKEVLKQYGVQIQNMKKFGDLILRNAAREGNSNIIECLLDSVQSGNQRDRIKEMLLATDGEGLTAWFISVASNKSQVLEKLWEWAGKKLTTEEINNKLLLGTDNMGRTAWHLAANESNLEILQKVWEWAEEKLTSEEINNKLLLAADHRGRTAWQSAAFWGNLEVLQKIYECANKKLTREEMNNKLLLGTDNGGKTAWHLAAEWGNLEVLHEIWECAQEKLTTEETNNKLLLGTDNFGMTAWHLAANKRNLEILQKVWEWAEEKLTTEEIKNNLLLGTDNIGRTAWHLAANKRNLEILQNVWECAEEELTTEEINNKLPLGTDNIRRTSWHLAANERNLEILQKVWEWAEEKLTTEEITNKLLLGRDQDGKTAWHLAAEGGNLELLHKIWECAKEKLTAEEINNKLLLGKDKEGKTACQLAAEESNLEVLHKISKWTEWKLTTEEINKLLLGTMSEIPPGT